MKALLVYSWDTHLVNKGIYMDEVLGKTEPGRVRLKIGDRVFANTDVASIQLKNGESLSGDFEVDDLELTQHIGKQCKLATNEGPLMVVESANRRNRRLRCIWADLSGEFKSGYFGTAALHFIT